MYNKLLKGSKLGLVVFTIISSLTWGEAKVETVFASEVKEAAQIETVTEEIEQTTQVETVVEEIEELGLEELVMSEDDITYMIDDTQEEENQNLKEEIITIKGSKFVADTFHGVKALYRTGKNDGTNATYSCAAYVKRYYSEVYGVSVSNLLSGCTPISSKGTIRKVSSPKEGDIVATTSGSGNHWAIVKQVNNNGTITLIEQNWKWQQDGKTVARVNRRVKISACKIYRLKK